MNSISLAVMVFVISLTLGVSGATVRADTVENLAIFSAGATARADEVNGNFSEVADSVNDNDARIAVLEDEIAMLRQQLSNVLNVNEYLSLEAVNDQPTVRLTGANLQIVNGMGETATSNGTGNLLIGYDERRESELPECSLGTNPNNGMSVTNELECLAAGGTFAANLTGGSHYLVVGPRHNYSRWGGIVAGQNNTSNFDFASVAGGARNTASGTSASVAGGWENTASGPSSSAIGGIYNTASGSSSHVSGGTSNTASGRESSVAGGFYNTASGSNSSVGGGLENVASGSVSSVAGGESNTASGISSSVSGGLRNEAGGRRSSVSGGLSNTASGEISSVSGGESNTASGVNATVGGGFNRQASGATDWAAGSLFEDE